MTAPTTPRPTPTRAIAAVPHRLALERAADLPDRLLDGLGCPLVMAEPPAWAGSYYRVLFLGQETAHWSIPGARTLRECLALDDPIAALAEAYAAFDFGVAAPRVHFIRALRRVERELEGGARGAVMWSNAAHVDCAPMGRPSASIAALPRADWDAVLAWQHGLLAAEVAELAPGALLAMCGPKYDGALLLDFPDLRFEPVGDAPPRDLARLVHPALPPASFRTHHPRTLEINKMPHLGTALVRVRAEAGTGEASR